MCVLQIWHRHKFIGLIFQIIRISSSTQMRGKRGSCVNSLAALQPSRHHSTRRIRSRSRHRRWISSRLRPVSIQHPTQTTAKIKPHHQCKSKTRAQFEAALKRAPHAVQSVSLPSRHGVGARARVIRARHQRPQNQNEQPKSRRNNEQELHRRGYFGHDEAPNVLVDEGVRRKRRGDAEDDNRGRVENNENAECLRRPPPIGKIGAPAGEGESRVGAGSTRRTNRKNAKLRRPKREIECRVVRRRSRDAARVGEDVGGRGRDGEDKAQN